jgi:NADH-quinone oxidoreductase subunit A
MPESYPDTFFPVLVQIVLAVVIAGALIGLSFALGKRVKDAVKSSAYECGIVPTGTARERFSVKFYLVAIVFILFDIEAVFLYPWVVVYRQLSRIGRFFGFVEMLLFIALVLGGFFYVWKKGALDWSLEGTAKDDVAAPVNR